MSMCIYHARQPPPPPPPPPAKSQQSLVQVPETASFASILPYNIKISFLHLLSWKRGCCGEYCIKYTSY